METITLLFGVFLVLIVLNVPIAFAMAASAAVVVIQAGLPDSVVMQRIIFGVDSFPLLAVPLFLLAGELMDLGGLSRQLVLFANTCLGHVRGGLAHVAIVSNMIMSGLSGAGTADAAATGGILIPAMIKRGYSPAFSAAVLGAGAVLGPIIPPSIAMVVYGASANVSVGRLFVGGAVPGLIMAIYMICVSALIAKRRDYPCEPKASCGQLTTSFRDAIWGLLAPVIIIGGIMGGIFTPTEAASVAVAYSLFVGVFIYRVMKPSAFFPAVRRSFLLTAKIMFIIGAASSFSWLLARSNAPKLVSDGFMSLGGDPLAFLLLVNVMLLVLGCLMETVAILLIVVPLLFPLSTQLGIDPVFFGVMMTLTLSIGLVTPPVGMVMFVVTGIAKARVQDFTREVAPYLVAQLLSLVTITMFPVLVTWLPDLVFGPGRK